MRTCLGTELDQVQEIGGAHTSRRWHCTLHRAAAIEGAREPQLDWFPVGKRHRAYFLVIDEKDTICETYSGEVTGS